ncbi:sugar kinase [Lederbergia lenta]|uniref:Kinase, pfkB family n=1 Tax=Lederbergia lenta TaxID=1467 RepID=A0A2X4YNR2_LEDLE|nr:sugar kinase [Lederbergia lenta]MEC2326028.1 sugar kinase [Lederbergia lenta]SQI53345.1 kinase, pfkB family [Lederbergia lenta]
MQKLDVVTFGEAMAMFMAETPGPLHEIEHFTRELAGAETNVAIGLSRLGLKAGWASKVGSDAFGQFIMKRLTEENVDLEHVYTDERFPSGFQIKSKVLTGDPEVQYFRRGSAASFMGVEDFQKEYFSNARHLHMTGIPLAISSHTRAFAYAALSHMKEIGRTVSFDPNLRPTLWTSKQEMIEITNKIAQKADYVLPGISEGEILTGFNTPQDIASFYLDKGVKLVVIKLGDKGAFYKSGIEEGVVKPYEVKEVIDTVGAGDGFAVGLVSGLLENLSLQEAVLRGNAIGALAVQSAGDNDGYPNRQQLIEYMKIPIQEVN